MPDTAAHGRKPLVQPQQKSAHHADSAQDDTSDFDSVQDAPDLTSAAPLSSSAMLGLQRSIGNRATQRLIAQRKQSAPAKPYFPVKPVQRSISEHIQRYAFIGQKRAYTPYQAKPGDDRKVRSMVGDDKTRRFKDEAQMRAFAGGNAEGVGFVPERDDQWMSVNEFTVLGESHADDRSAKPIVKRLKINRFRYEAFTSYDKAKVEANKAARNRFKEGNKKRQEKFGLASGADDQAHAAESILPKFARVIPDFNKLVQDQAAGRTLAESEHGAEARGQSIQAGAKWAETYSLVKALHESFYDALIYALAFEGGSGGHPLRALVTIHGAAMRQSVEGFKRSQAAGRVPNYSTLGVGTYIQVMAQAYKKAAYTQLNIASDQDLTRKIATLNTVGEADVTLTGEAKRMDYMRDLSMLQKIQQAKGSDLLFVIGAAHLKKLQPLIAQEGAIAQTVEEFRREQTDEDAAAEAMLVAPEPTRDRGVAVTEAPGGLAAPAAPALPVPPPPPLP